MYFFFHLFIGILLGFLISDFFNDRRWLIPCAAGAILPDLIDKPVGYILFPATIGPGRIYSHAFLVALLVLAVGLVIWKVKKNPGVIAVGVGILSHQVLDLMWLQPQNWYYPLLGQFKGQIIQNYFFTKLFEEFNNPSEIILAFILGAGILAFIYRHKIMAFISRNRPVVSITAAVCALLLCILSGIILGRGIAKHTLPVIGWSSPEELIIGGIVIALSACMVWRFRNVINKQ